MSESTDPTTEPDPIPGEGDPVATGTEGGGEWPDPETPATGPAPGTVPGASKAMKAEREERVVADPEAVYGDGDERAAVATMPEEERDRLLGRDDQREARAERAEAPQPGDDAEIVEE